jgi:Uma2 family endonuclease
MESAIALPQLIMKPKVTPRYYTLEEYLRKEERASERSEYYDGTIIKLPMARGTHNIIGGNTISALTFSLEEQGKNYLIFTSNQKVYLPALNISLYPDVLVVCEKPLYWDNNEVLLINPVMIIEVLSKSTSIYDRRDKFLEYKTLESFKEYVLINQYACEIETRFREEPNLWRENVVKDINSSIFFNSMGCAVKLSKIYKNIEFPPQKPKKLPKK